MPQLKQLSCCIQWADTGAPFQEHGTLYGDGIVETFIIVPSKPQGFSIRLTSQGFISEGLVMVVFIDGNYQCNRSRINLLPPSATQATNRTNIDFLLRQKEKTQGDGVYLGREWRFDSHNIVDEPPAGLQEGHFEDLGIIEILVLRCRARTQEEAGYSGSSSGEDSDIFEERSGMNEKETTCEASVPVSTTNSEPLATVTNPTVEEDEDEVDGLMGLFDGAYDVPYSRGGPESSEEPSRRWIWHQKNTPFGSSYDFSPHSQPDSIVSHPHRHTQPAAFSQGQPLHDQRAYRGPSERRVHFANSPPGREGYNVRNIESEPTSHHSRRPDSRTRRRQPSNPVNSHDAPPYGHQRIPNHIPQSSRYGAHDTYSRPGQPFSLYQDDPVPTPGHGSRPMRCDEKSSQYPTPPAGHEVPRPMQAGHDGDPHHDEKRRRPYLPNAIGSSSGSSQHLGPSPPNPSHDTIPRQDSWNNSGVAPPMKMFTNQSHAVPHGNPYTTGRDYSHSKDGNPHGSQATHAPAGWHPTFIPNHPSPYVPYIPHEHHYHGGYHLGYWQAFPFNPYGPSYAYGPPTRQATATLHPPHGSHPGMEEQISPRNTTVGEQHQGHSTHSVPETWPNQGGSVEQQGGWNGNDDNNQTQDDTVNKDEINNMDESSGWGDNNNNGGNDWNKDNQGDTNQAAQSNDWNADTNNQNNEDWGDNNANNAVNNTEWNNDSNDNNGWSNQADNTPAVNNNDDWSTPAANEEPSDTGNKTSGSNNQSYEGDAPRDLYGPHGPYYALRADRSGETRPDAEEEPRYDVPKAWAAERRSTKQVQPGPGYRYYKKRTAPEYIDTMENPYARFVFKYRTKDQLLNEIGIEVDVEPTGNAEIQDLQNLDKQALIEMLMRAKGALGGKIPSPASTPSASVQGSDSGAPITINAPKQAYLKYSLPPLRPSNSKARISVSKGKRNEPDVANGSGGKGNDQSWDAPNNNNGDTWGDNGDKGGGNMAMNNNNTWSAWDGAEVKDSVVSTGRRASQSQQAVQANSSGNTKQSANFEWTQRESPPPRPVTPTGPETSQKNVDQDWDAAEDSTGWNNTGKAASNTDW